jgi:hypothetical protein
LHLREQHLQEETYGREGERMDEKSSHPKVTRVWMPGKCIPQALEAPKYFIKSTRIGDHTSFVRYHALS